MENNRKQQKQIIKQHQHQQYLPIAITKTTEK